MHILWIEWAPHRGPPLGVLRLQTDRPHAKLSALRKGHQYIRPRDVFASTELSGLDKALAGWLSPRPKDVEYFAFCPKCGGILLLVEVIGKRLVWQHLFEAGSHHPG